MARMDGKAETCDMKAFKQASRKEGVRGLLMMMLLIQQQLMLQWESATKKP